MFSKYKSVEDLALELTTSENKLEAEYTSKKETLRNKFVNSLKSILQSKKENVELLTQSLEKIEEKRESEQQELEAAQSKLKELEEK